MHTTNKYITRKSGDFIELYVYYFDMQFYIPQMRNNKYPQNRHDNHKVYVTNVVSFL